MSCLICETSDDEREIEIGRGPFGHPILVHLSCYLRQGWRLRERKRIASAESAFAIPEASE